MTARVTLHIGAPKTGTTSIQQFCRDNEAVLARRGVIYPGPALHPAFGKAINHNILVFALTGAVGNLVGMDCDAARRLLGEIVSDAVATSSGQILFSHEMLYGGHERLDAAALRRLVGGAAVRIVLYARRLDEWNESLYRQLVWGRVQPAHVARQERIPEIGETGHVKHVERRTVSAVLASYRAALPQAEVAVRPFSVMRASGGLMADFLETLGLDAVEVLAEAAPERRRNDAKPEPLTMLMWHLQRAAMPIPDCFEVGRAGQRKARLEGGVPGFEGRRFRFLSEADARRAFDLYQADAARFEALAPDRAMVFEPQGAAERGLTRDDAERLMAWLEPSLPPDVARTARKHLKRALPG